MESNITVLGEGADIINPQKKITQIVLPDSHRKGHFWCFGTTRSGKTRMMENMIEQDIKKGYSVVVIDPKGDIDLLAKIVQVSLMENREEDLMLLTPIYPDYSVKLSPLSHFYMPEELVAHIVSGIEEGREPFFDNVAYEISLMVVKSLLIIAQNEKRPPSVDLLQIKKYIARENLEKLHNLLDTVNLPDAPRIRDGVKSILASPQDYYAKISSSLRVTLTELTEGNVGEVIGRTKQNDLIDRLEAGKRVILVVQLGSLLTQRAAYTIGKVILSTIQSYVGRIFASGRTVSPPLAVYIDEAQNVLYHGIDDFFAKAGGAGVWIHGFCQSINQVYSGMGTKEKGKVILDNTNTKVFMRVPDPETALYASENFGTKMVFSPIISGIDALNSKAEEVEVVKPDVFANLKPRFFFMKSYNGKFAGTTKTVSPLYLKIKFPQINTERIQ